MHLYPGEVYLCPDPPLQTELLCDLGPGPPLPAQAPGSENRTPQCRPADRRGVLTVQAGSAGGGGAGQTPQGPQLRDGSGETPRRKVAGGREQGRATCGAAPTPPVAAMAARHPGAPDPGGRPGSPSLTQSSVTVPHDRRPPSKQQQVMRRRGSRDAQVVCSPQAAACRSRPLPLRGSGSGTSRVGRGVRGSQTQGWDRWGESDPALRRGWPKGSADAGGATAGGGAGGTLAYLPHSWPRVRREPADRLTSGYQETLSCFCRDRRLLRGAESPNFRRRRRRLSRQMGVTCDCLGRACATLLFSSNGLS